MLILRYANAVVGATRRMYGGSWWVVYCGGGTAPLEPKFVDNAIVAWHHVKHELETQHAEAERAKYG